MFSKLKARMAAAVFLAGTLGFTGVQAYAGGFHGRHIDHVLLISVDGMHAVDFANCASGIPGVNNGQPYCPNLAALAQTGVNYVNSTTSKPSDSFPGLMALMTGSTPRTMGVYYDVAYDRSLNPPAQTSGNGNPGATCTLGATPPGTTTEYDEGSDLNKNALNGGAPSGDGGINSINPAYVIRDGNCNPVYLGTLSAPIPFTEQYIAQAAILPGLTNMRPIRRSAAPPVPVLTLMSTTTMRPRSIPIRRTIAQATSR
jgi:Type I phosphodiesterase / nucleotide pyrophosphatase